MESLGCHFSGQKPLLLAIFARVLIGSFSPLSLVDQLQHNQLSRLALEYMVGSETWKCQELQNPPKRVIALAQEAPMSGLLDK